MTDDEARRFVVENVTVRRQQIILMKALLLKHFSDNPTAMLEAAVWKLGAAKPHSIVLHQSVDPLPALKQFAEWIGWWIAGCEALWGLVHRNVLLPVAAGMNTFHPGIEWTNIVPGSGGQRAGWDFPEFKLCYPNMVARSRAVGVSEVLCDPDLFLQELNLPHLHAEVEDALREAVSCFRGELYIAAIVMLGKASEGTWIEFGLALLPILPPDEATKRGKLQQEWSGPDVGFSKKMRDIMKLVETRSEERRVGKECRSRWSPYH